VDLVDGVDTAPAAAPRSAAVVAPGASANAAAAAAAAAAGTTLGAAMAGARGGGGVGEDGAGAAASRVEGLCPVCQEEYGQQTDLAVMPCGHMLCARCMVAMEGHLTVSTAMQHVRALHPGRWLVSQRS
jgi:hypothetical protein